MPHFPGQTASEHQRLGVACAAGASITYSLIVIWYVATFPDVGIRALFPMEPDERQLLITQFVHAAEECDAMPGDSRPASVEAFSVSSREFFLSTRMPWPLCEQRRFLRMVR